MYDTTKPYVSNILKLIQETWDTPYLSVDRETGAEIRKQRGSDASSVDGIGTKGLFHWRKRSFRAAVQDALAMNLNDLLLMRAQAYRLHDHIMLPQDDPEAVHDLVSALVEEAKKRDIAVLSGETAILNTLRGLEISLTVIGFVKQSKPNVFTPGDYLMGVRSNGIHSNGLTLARRVLGNRTIRPEFICPTRIYYDEILPLLGRFNIRGMVHITGGGFSKLKRLLGNSTDAIITRDHRLEPYSIFQDIFLRGVNEPNMYSTFNCGIGFMVALPPAEADAFKSCFPEGDADIIGELRPGRGVVWIQSKLSSANFHID